jgi:hypothetical protein
MQPSWRKPFGMFVIVGLIIVLAIVVGSLSPWIGQLPVLAQTLVYLVAALIWIAPLKPLLRWMETGEFKGW